MGERTQHAIAKPGLLLDEQGHLREPGYATSLLMNYNRDAVRAHRMRLKEWDYYLIYDDEVAVAITVATNTIFGLFSIAYVDLKNAVSHSVGYPVIFPLRSVQLPTSSARGFFKYRGGRIKADINVHNGGRCINFEMHDFEKGDPFVAHLTLLEEPRDSMVIATPFDENDKAFYYNQKIVSMRAQGTVTTSAGSHAFSPERSFALLDWGRGVWPYKSTWYWGSACGLQGGRLIGFSIGYGFGNTSAATENMLFVDGIAHKLDDVVFNIPVDGEGRERFCDPWTFTSNDGRFEMDFLPIVDRASKTNLGIIESDQHQVFGRFTGTMVCDDGGKLKVEDMIGFAEKVMNKW
jgi:hypothetical protein